jgi:hypothetical protein
VSDHIDYTTTLPATNMMLPENNLIVVYYGGELAKDNVVEFSPHSPVLSTHRVRTVLRNGNALRESGETISAP